MGQIPTNTYFLPVEITSYGNYPPPPSLFKKTFERVEPSNFLFFQMSPKTKIRNDSSERGSRIISYQKIIDLFCQKSLICVKHV